MAENGKIDGQKPQQNLLDRYSQQNGIPWQERDRRPYNPDTAIGPSPRIGATIKESSAPISPPVVGKSDEQYAREARANMRGKPESERGR